MCQAQSRCPFVVACRIPQFRSCTNKVLSSSTGVLTWLTVRRGRKDAHHTRTSGWKAITHSENRATRLTWLSGAAGWDTNYPGMGHRNEQLTYIKRSKTCVFWKPQVTYSEWNNITLQVCIEWRLSERFKFSIKLVISGDIFSYRCPVDLLTGQITIE